MFRQLLDRIAAVQQDALFAIDIGDRAPRAGRAGEAGVEREMPSVLVQGADVDAGRTQGPGHQGQLGAALVRFVNQLHFCIRHGQLLPQDSATTTRLRDRQYSSAPHGTSAQPASGPTTTRRQSTAYLSRRAATGQPGRTSRPVGRGPPPTYSASVAGFLLAA